MVSLTIICREQITVDWKKSKRSVQTGVRCCRLPIRMIWMLGTRGVHQIVEHEKLHIIRRIRFPSRRPDLRGPIIHDSIQYPATLPNRTFLQLFNNVTIRRHRDLVSLEGSLDGVLLVVNPFELLQGSALGFDSEEVPSGGLHTVPPDKDVCVLVADVSESDRSSELIDEADSCWRESYGLVWVSTLCDTIHRRFRRSTYR